MGGSGRTGREDARCEGERWKDSEEIQLHGDGLVLAVGSSSELIDLISIILSKRK